MKWADLRPISPKLWSIVRKEGIASTAVANLVVQISKPAIAIITLPFLLGRLGQSGLGVWMIALSMMGLIATVNGGLSVSLATLVGRAMADPSSQMLQRLASGGTLIAGGTALVVAAVAVPAALFVDWGRLLKISSEPIAQEVPAMMLVLAFILAAGMISAVPRQIMVGRMHGHLAALLDLGSGVIAATALLVAIGLHAPLWALALAYMLPPVAVMMAGGALYLSRHHIPWFSRRHFHRETALTLGRDSVRMTGYYTAYSVSSQSDLLLIGAMIGAPSAATYGVAQRVFSLPVMVSAALNYAQWPALARADAAGNQAYVALLLRQTLFRASGLATLVALACALFYQPLITLWLGHTVPTDVLIIAGMVMWVLVATLVNTFDVVLRARNETAFMMRCMIAMAVINLGVSLFLLPRIGAAGAVWGSVTGYSLGLLLPYAFRVRLGSHGQPVEIGSAPHAD